MDRNILDDLMNLLKEPGPVNWALAEQTAGHLTGPRAPVDPWLADEYMEMFRLAAYRLEEQTDFRLTPVNEPIPLDPAGWASLNIRSFRYMVEPIAERFADSAGGGMEAILRPLAPALLGMQMGAAVGLLGRAALGQFDAGLPTASPGPIGFIVSNIESFTEERGLDSRQVRLWAAFQETIREAMLNREWVRPHFLRLIGEMQDDLRLDSSVLGFDSDEINDPERLRAALAGGADFPPGGMSVTVEGPGLDAVNGFMAILDGYADYALAELAGNMIPDREAIQRAMRERAEDSRDDPHAGQLVAGPEREHGAGHWGAGAEFCAEVEQRWGREAVAKIWESPDRLPAPGEIADATGWAARVLLDDPFPA